MKLLVEIYRFFACGEEGTYAKDAEFVANDFEQAHNEIQNINQIQQGNGYIISPYELTDEQRKEVEEYFNTRS